VRLFALTGCINYAGTTKGHSPLRRCLVLPVAVPPPPERQPCHQVHAETPVR
jgi:hypothetical protein